MTWCYGDTQQMSMALGLSIVAGLSGAVGCAIVFLLPKDNKVYLAGASAFAAGVMIFIALAEVLAEDSIANFMNAGYSGKEAHLYATLCFFAGFPITWALDKLTHIGLNGLQKHEAATSGKDDKEQKETNVELGMSLVTGKVADVDADVVAMITSEEEKASLNRTGYMAAVVMCLHNLPEGIAMFVGWMAGTGPGIIIAIAFILHNIPEGMIVAMPIYYASGSKLKGFLWGTMSTMCLPLGALIGMGITCQGLLTELTMGIVFGMVAGLLTYLSLIEFYPLAIKYDPENKARAACFIAGIWVIAASIVVVEWAAVPPADPTFVTR